MSVRASASALAALSVALLSGAAAAAPGDIHRVAGAEVVNLRADHPTTATSAGGSSRATR